MRSIDIDGNLTTGMLLGLLYASEKDLIMEAIGQIDRETAFGHGGVI